MIEAEPTKPSMDLSKDPVNKLKDDLMQRKGIFRVHSDLVEKEPELLLNTISPYVFVIGVDKDLFANDYRFRAYSPLFDSVKEGEVIPNYIFHIMRGDSPNKYNVFAERLGY